VSELRVLGVNDVEKLKGLLRVCWLDTYTGILPASVIDTALEVWHSRENLTRGLQNAQGYFVGAFDDGKLTGMASAAKVDDDTLQIYQLYVLPSQQRKGLGTKLVDACISHFGNPPKITLEVEEGNQKGIGFYRKYGFTYPSKRLVTVGDKEIPCLVGELVDYSPRTTDSAAS
jgi:ribosomal protein S18 acetylase RimI-like enzyme